MVKMPDTAGYLEMLYDDRCDVIQRMRRKDPETKVTSFVEETVHENLKCAISFSSGVTAQPRERAAALDQKIKLFVSPEPIINPGSKIIVTNQHGEVTAYKNSGVPAVYADHVEIPLDLFDKWA